MDHLTEYEITKEEVVEFKIKNGYVRSYKDWCKRCVNFGGTCWFCGAEIDKDTNLRCMPDEFYPKKYFR